MDRVERKAEMIGEAATVLVTFGALKILDHLAEPAAWIVAVVIGVATTAALSLRR